jgi:hypothetical protein
MRTKAAVRELLAAAGFSLHQRDGDDRPWIRDYVYGDRVGPNLEPEDVSLSEGLRQTV